jgi:diguanylate cyclase (GGDEF)-like protein
MAAPTSTIATADRSSGVAATFRSGKPLLVADAGTSGYCDAAAVEATACASVYFAPIAGDDGPVGVLALSWSVRQAELSDRLQVTLDTLCHEGAVALDRVALLERLDDLASTDPLTGLANRRVWDERMNLEMRRARGHQEPLAVAILDIDHFKAYNDSRGHPAGDRLLRTLSASLTARLRDTDTVARLGGEEFGVLLPRCGSETAQELLYRLRNAIPDGQTCSAGYAIWDHAETAEQLLKRADEALYQAKRDGRDRTRAAEAV